MVSCSDSPVSSPHAFVLLDTLDSQNVHHSGSSVQCTRLTELTRVPDGTRPRQAFSRCSSGNQLPNPATLKPKPSTVSNTTRDSWAGHSKRYPRPQVRPIHHYLSRAKPDDERRSKPPNVKWPILWTIFPGHCAREVVRGSGWHSCSTEAARLLNTTRTLAHFRALPSKYDKPFYFGEGSPTQRIFNVELQRLALC